MAGVPLNAVPMEVSHYTDAVTWRQNLEVLSPQVIVRVRPSGASEPKTGEIQARSRPFGRIGARCC